MDGKNIARVRRQKGITQEELAQALSINTTTLSRWENDHFEPKTSMLKEICEVLGCTESELLNGQSPDEWELRILVNKKGVETVDMTTSKSSAVLNMSDDTMAIMLSAGYELWEDDAKFEELIEDIRRKRKIGLRTRKEDW